MKKILLMVAIGFALSACAGRQVTKVQPLSDTADAPYANVLVVSLFSSFDRRRIFERAIVKELSERGVRAVASTSRMTTKTPLSRETFVAMVEELGSDGVLVTQLVGVDTTGKVKTKRPEATYNVSATRYFNVWNVDYTEYREPPSIETTDTLRVATQMYSARTKEPVWAMETETKISRNLEDPLGYTVIGEQAGTIARYLASDGLIAR